MASCPHPTPGFFYLSIFKKQLPPSAPHFRMNFRRITSKDIPPWQPGSWWDSGVDCGGQHTLTRARAGQEEGKGVQGHEGADPPKRMQARRG